MGKYPSGSEGWSEVLSLILFPVDLFANGVAKTASVSKTEAVLASTNI